MKKLFTILSVLFCLSGYATNVTIGTGSGSVIRNSMGALTSGDTLFINAGTYSGGGQFGGLANITITNIGGLVTFKGNVDFGNQQSTMSNIHWTGSGVSGLLYGFVFNGAGGFGNGPLGAASGDAVTFTSPNNNNIRLDHISFQSINGICMNLSGYGQNYNGTTASLKLYKATFSNMRADGCFDFMQGTYLSLASLANQFDSVTWANDSLTNTVTTSTVNGFAGQYVNAVCMHFNVHDNVMLYTGGQNTTERDEASFVFVGSGKIYRNYLHGGRGYIMRCFGASQIASPDDVWFYDNIKLATTKYGVCDGRSDVATYGGTAYFQGTNFHIINNTGGNLYDLEPDNPFVTPIFVQYVLSGGATAEVRNNLLFNSNPSLGATNAIVGYESTGTVDTSNNNYYSASVANSTVLSDTNALCAVRTGSPIIAHGLHFASITTDFVQYPWANPPSTGAREFQTATVVCNAGANQAYTKPPVSSATLTSSSTGPITSYNWVQTSGPNSAAITNGTTSVATASGLIAGTYAFQLQLNGNTSNCLTQVVISAHTAPTASAGSNQTITLPVNSVNVSGSATYFDGATAGSYAWSKVSGGTAVITSPSSQNTSITGLVQGTYIFAVTVTDSYGTASSPSQITITVNAAIPACPNCLLQNPGGGSYLGVSGLRIF